LSFYREILFLADETTDTAFFRSFVQSVRDNSFTFPALHKLWRKRQLETTTLIVASHKIIVMSHVVDNGNAGQNVSWCHVIAGELIVSQWHPQTT